MHQKEGEVLVQKRRLEQQKLIGLVRHSAFAMFATFATVSSAGLLAPASALFGLGNNNILRIPNAQILFNL
jgi:hypothetical protein